MQKDDADTGSDNAPVSGAALLMDGQISASVEQPISVAEDKPVDSLFYFFAAGIVVNIVLILAYFLWATRQWKMKGKEND